MKKFIFVLIIAVALPLLGAETVSFKTGMVMRTTTDTLPAAVTIYADGQVVRGPAANAMVLSVEIPKFNNLDTAGFAYQVKLEMDSVSANGNFDIWVFNDSAALGANLTANHGVAQFRRTVGNRLVGIINASCTVQGSAAAGAETQVADVQWMHPYVMPDKVKNRLYFLIIARGAWTPKQSGVIRLTVYMDAKI